MAYVEPLADSVAMQTSMYVERLVPGVEVKCATGVFSECVCIGLKLGRVRHLCKWL